MDKSKTDLLQLARIAFAQAKGTLDAATQRVLIEIGETYLKSAAAAGLRLSPLPDGCRPIVPVQSQRQGHPEGR